MSMDVVHKDELRKLINKWKAEYDGTKEVLAEFGDLSNQGTLIEYNIECVQAMTLLECISNVQLLFDD